MTDVLVTGAAGKMGGLSAATIAAQSDLRVVALVDPRRGAAAGDAPCFDSVDKALALTSPQAALEFSVPQAVFENTRLLLEAGVPTVVGATGLRDEQVNELSAAAAGAGVGLLIVPNFALGAVLLMRFASEAAKHYEHAEIIELTRRTSATRRRAPACARPVSWPRRRDRRCAICPARSSLHVGWPPTMCVSIACACRAWWRTRRYCWAATTSCLRCVTTRSHGARS